jgi:DNA-binding transcriptional regulator YdaS (Cro superfamily)
MFSKIKLRSMEISIKQIAQKAGGVVAMSKALGLSRGAVSQWKKVPLDRVVDVERITGISRRSLRPDVFDENIIAHSPIPVNVNQEG